ncbi:MAG: hypothetical protein ACLFO2_00525 [Candidatus Woesearchaeota archaeon]
MASKKGSERLNLIIISITIVAVALTIFIAAAADADTQHRYLADFYSHDLALLIEATQAVPGDVTIRYPLEEDFEASLERDAVTVRNTRSGVTQTQPYRPLEDMTYKEGEASDVVHLTKHSRTISFGKEDTITAMDTECPPMPSTEGEHTIRAQAGTATTGAAFTKSELKAMADVLNAKHLEDEGLAGNQGSFLALKLTSREPDDDGRLTFKRPEAEGAREQAYQHLYCTLKKELQGTSLALKEEKGAETESYEVRIELAFTKDQADALDQNRFLSSIAEAWAHLGEEEVES